MIGMSSMGFWSGSSTACDLIWWKAILGKVGQVVQVVADHIDRRGYLSLLSRPTLLAYTLRKQLNYVLMLSISSLQIPPTNIQPSRPNQEPEPEPVAITASPTSKIESTCVNHAVHFPPRPPRSIPSERQNNRNHCLCRSPRNRHLL